MAAASTLGNTTGDLQSLCECPVCLEYFVNPRLLKCGHQFCEGCLEGIIEVSPRRAATCPTCRVVTDTQDGDVGSLPRSTLHQYMQDVILQLPAKQSMHAGKMCTKCERRKPTRHCPDCREDLSYMCDECFQKHQLVPRFQKHETVTFDPLLICDKHPNKMVECFCHHCIEMVCDDCIFETHGDHGKHVQDMKTVADNSRKVLQKYTKDHRNTAIDWGIIKLAEQKKVELMTNKSLYSERIETAVFALENVITVLQESKTNMTATAEEDIARISKFQTEVSDVCIDQEKILKLAEGLLQPEVSNPQVIMGSRNLPKPDICGDSITLRYPANIEQLNDIVNQVEQLTVLAEYKPTPVTIAVHRGPVTGSQKQSESQGDQMPAKNNTGSSAEPEKWQLRMMKTVQVKGSIHGIVYVEKRQEFVVLFEQKRQTILYRYNQNLVYIASVVVRSAFNSQRGLRLSIRDRGVSRSCSLALDTKRDHFLLTSTDGVLYVMDDNDGKVIKRKEIGNQLQGVAYAPKADLYVVIQGLNIIFLSPDNLSLVGRNLIKSVFYEVIGQLSWHICVADINDRETIFAASTQDRSISMYNITGAFIGEFFRARTDNLQITPLRLHSTASGSLFVCELASHRSDRLGTGTNSLVHYRAGESDRQRVQLLDNDQIGGGCPTGVAVAEGQKVLALVVDQKYIKLFSNNCGPDQGTSNIPNFQGLLQFQSGI